MTIGQPINFIADASVVLIGIESVLTRSGYPVQSALREQIRNHCIRRAVEEILLIDAIEAPTYMDFAYQLVKNNYVRLEHGHHNALLEDVNRFCLQYCLSTSSFPDNAALAVRGRWFTATVYQR